MQYYDRAGLCFVLHILLMLIGSLSISILIVQLWLWSRYHGYVLILICTNVMGWDEFIKILINREEIAAMLI